MSNDKKESTVITEIDRALRLGNEVAFRAVNDYAVVKVLYRDSKVTLQIEHTMPVLKWAEGEIVAAVIRECCDEVECAKDLY